MKTLSPVIQNVEFSIIEALPSFVPIKFSATPLLHIMKLLTKNIATHLRLFGVSIYFFK